MRKRWFAVVAAGVFVAGCLYPADGSGECVTPVEDRVYIDNGTVEPGLYCFDDGDGYPAVYPPVTTAPGYPTVAP